jgi:ligand-binding sensor domain-containing protein
MIFLRLLFPLLAAVVLLTWSPCRCRAEDNPAPGHPPLFLDWYTFTREDGLPSDKIFALATQGDRLWVGTENGLAAYEDGRWRRFGVEDGLAHRVVTSVAPDPATGDVWVATFGGLSRLSGGRFDNFTQLNSGLVNDVVYGVAVQDRYVWTATAAGTSRLDTWNGQWEIFTNRNAPMHEIWCYGITASEGQVHVAVWGGGVLRWDVERARWREFRDPDGEMELDLLRDDGPVSDVTASVAYSGGVLWVATYFGVNRYDGRHWSGFSVDDSGLASDFVNFVASDGPTAWFATDSGLSHFDGETWTTYRRNPEGEPGGTITVRSGDQEKTLSTPTSLADNFVLAVARRGEEIWVGTEKGLSRGLPARRNQQLALDIGSRKGDRQ